MSSTKLLAITFAIWLLMRAVNKDASGRTLIDHILGHTGSAGSIPLGQTLPGSTSGLDPFPGASTAGGRLDQGLDLTSRTFLAPFNAKVLVADQTSPGWAGGGYLALQDLANPSRIIYMAEGIAPTVTVGATIAQGQKVGNPVTNPYNMAVGNIETGLASPANPRQPLAQVTKNPKGSVLGFYNWLRSLGVPPVASTAGAGHP